MYNERLKKCQFENTLSIPIQPFHVFNNRFMGIPIGANFTWNPPRNIRCIDVSKQSRVQREVHHIYSKSTIRGYVARLRYVYMSLAIMEALWKPVRMRGYHLTTSNEWLHN